MSRNRVVVWTKVLIRHLVYVWIKALVTGITRILLSMEIMKHTGLEVRMHVGIEGSGYFPFPKKIDGHVPDSRLRSKDILSLKTVH